MRCLFNMCNFIREEEYLGPYPPKRWKFAIPTKFSVALSEATGIKISSPLEFELENDHPETKVAYYYWKPK